ncbi:MAG: DUF3307 domain-containing protein [Flavobacteriaceae bacterium]|nr:DUF3307 domain-containing protein [Flavobacteriaceae bacterium]
MGFTEFLILQVLAHLLADFFFQTQRMAEDKNARGFKSSYLTWHILIVFLLSWGLSFQLKFFIGAGVIAILHYFIDGMKAKWNDHSRLQNSIFFIDQALHVIVLLSVSFAYSHFYRLEFWWEPNWSVNTWAIITAYLFCMRPANFIIKEILKSSNINIMIAEQEAAGVLSETVELPNAGKLIGTLERLLTLTFILIGEFEAVGFLLAAKSLLRYKDTDTLKSEYVLIGTMLSFGMAVVLGIIAMAI